MKKKRNGDAESTEGVTFEVPHDTTNEAVVLAAIVVAEEESRAKLLDRLPTNLFLTPEYNAAIAGLKELKQRKLTYDPATLQRLVGDKLDVALLGQLADERPDVPENLESHIAWLNWDHQRGTVAAGPLPAYLTALRNPSEAPERVRALARQLADAHRGSHGAGKYLFDPKMLVRDQMAEVRKRIEGHARFPYGIPGVDSFEEGARDEQGRDISGTTRMLPGAAPGQVTLLTGLSGGGKTTLAGHILLGLARQPGRGRGLYCAWEPKGGMTLELAACLTLKWSRTLLMQGLDQEDPSRRSKMPHAQQVLLEERMHGIAKKVTFMWNPFRRQMNDKHQSNEKNLDIVHEQIVDSGASWAIFDLWERCLVSDKPSDEKSALMRQQAMCEETNTHGILLAQQRLKDIEMRADKRPTREGIKGSGAWVEVADTIIGVHRPGQWKSIADDTIEAFVLKQRYGKWPLGVELEWNGEKGSIEGGKSIRYDQPGETGGLGGLDGDFAPVKETRKRGKSR